MIISLDAEKGLQQNPTPLHDKGVGEIRHIRNISKHNKRNKQQASNSIKLNGENLKAIPLKSRTRQGCTLSPYLFNIDLEVLARAIREQSEIKGKQIGEEVKSLLFADDMIVYINDPKNYQRDLLKLKNTFIKVSGYNIDSKKKKKPVSSPYTNDKLRKKSGKQYPSQ